jgi:hypothetical protein
MLDREPRVPLDHSAGTYPYVTDRDRSTRTPLGPPTVLRWDKVAIASDHL